MPPVGHDVALFRGGKRFVDVTAEFLQHRSLYSDDRRTTPSNIRILERHLGELRITDITPKEIEAMIAARISEGVGRATVNRQRATLSKFFSWAIGRGYHPGPNPVKGVMKFRESPGRTRYLAPEEAKKLILAAAHHLKPILMTALHTGGRLSELLALRWADLDLDRRVLVFRKETTKSRRERIVPIDDELVTLLRALRPGAGQDLLFDYNGRGMKNVRTAFSTARRKAGLEDIHFHDLRHTFASWAVMNGLDIYRLQTYMGHSTISLTQRYAHLSGEFLQDGARFFGPPRSARRTDEKES